MALWKIFLVVLLAVLFAVLFMKFWRLILIIIALPIAIIIDILLKILFLPIHIVLHIFGYDSEENIQTKMVEQYDNIFFKANSRKKIKRRIEKINTLEKILSSVKENERDKEIKKLLKECKWTL